MKSAAATKSKSIHPSRKTAASRWLKATAQVSLPEPVHEDVVELILRDHAPLKNLMQNLRDSSAKLFERQLTFLDFASAFANLAKPKEQSLYIALKQCEDTRTEAFQGDMAHALAEQLIEEIKKTEDPYQWSAKIKVLTDLVERHLREEEESLLPRYQKSSTANDRCEIGEIYTHLREEMLKQRDSKFARVSQLRRVVPRYQYHMPY